MTIEREATRLGRLAHRSGVAVAALTVWFGGVLAVTAVAEPTPTVLVLDPGYRTAPALGRAGGALAGALGPFLQVQRVERGFVARLYAAGGLLVLPIPAPGGCIGLRPALAAGA